jgi:hypothetical protein
MRLTQLIEEAYSQNSYDEFNSKFKSAEAEFQKVRDEFNKEFMCR